MGKRIPFKLSMSIGPGFGAAVYPTGCRRSLIRQNPRFVVLAKMDNAGTRSVVDSFSAVLNRQPAAMRKSMTYDQGREMHGHKILTERTCVQTCFADPHNPWQRGSNGNTHGLLRQYMPKGSDLAIYSQEERDAIALCSIPSLEKDLDGKRRLPSIPSIWLG